MIEEERKVNGVHPKEMMTLYDYLHEKHMAKATKIKVMQEE